jgi:hypothetical protein
MPFDRTVPRNVAFDYAVGICSVWIASGFFLDAWAHGHVEVETFFTPYHAVFYSGMVAMLAIFAAFWLRHRALPPGYRFAVLGIPLFFLAGVGDLIWHTIFGIEEGVDALLSPTHQGLGFSMFVLSSGPIRSVLMDRARATTLRMQLPFVLGLATWLILVHFGTAYAFDPAAGRTNAPPTLNGFSPDYMIALAIGYYKISIGVLVMIFQAALMCGFAVWATSKIRLQPGCFTLFYLIANTPAAAAFTNDTPLLGVTVLQSLVAGIVADTLVARLDPEPNKPSAYRIFAIAVPMTYMGTYLLAMLGIERVWWDWNENLGAWLWTGVVGAAVSFIGLARRTT